MRKLVILAGALSLAGCQTVADIDAAVQSNIPRACAIMATIHTALVTVNAARPIKASIVTKEAQAMAAAETICADPANVKVANAPIVIANAYAAMLLVKAEIDKQS